jgi:hypothetical protein
MTGAAGGRILRGRSPPAAFCVVRWCVSCVGVAARQREHVGPSRAPIRGEIREQDDYRRPRAARALAALLSPRPASANAGHRSRVIH